MKRRSLRATSAEIRRTTEAAVASSRKLAGLVEQAGQQLVFRSAVTSTLERYRQELVAGKARRSLKDVLDSVESFFVLQAMRTAEENIARAAELLRMPEATLRYKMGKHGLR